MTARSAPVLLWLRRDLSLADNPALRAALASGRPDAAYVPELAKLPDSVIHAPVVDLAAGRDRALLAFAALRKAV